jgi:polysaccharide export outer membrane protein
MKRHVLFAIALSILPVLSASAQEAEEPKVVVALPPAPPPFVNMRGFSDDYKVGPGDLLEIQVIGREDLKYELRVSNSGEISFPMLGLVQVNDLTGFEVEAEVARRLREKGLVDWPEVMAYIKEYQSKPIYVSGAVVNPGEFVMSQDLTVVDAILLAGGLKVTAGDEALLHRRASKAAGAGAPDQGGSRPGTEVVRIDLRGIKNGQFPSESLPLRRGDVLVVPEQVMHAFFVVGDVVAPRDYRFQPGQTVLASQAISWAGGPLPWAKMSEGMLVRYDANGNRSELKADYAAILEGRQPDFPVLKNDIIFIPGSRAKTIAHGLIGITDLMVMQASFRAGRKLSLPDQPDYGQ